jgi:hypothetical protein
MMFLPWKEDLKDESYSGKNSDCRPGQTTASRAGRLTLKARNSGKTPLQSP